MGGKKGDAQLNAWFSTAYKPFINELVLPYSCAMQRINYNIVLNRHTAMCVIFKALKIVSKTAA